MISKVEVDEMIGRVAMLEETCSPLQLRLTPLQALVVLTGLQVAYQHLDVTIAARSILEDVGRRIQDNLGSYDVEVGRTLEAGWKRPEV